MRNLTMKELFTVSGGKKKVVDCGNDGDGECEVEVKGNNGWGNGADGTNPGSNSGGTAGSKSDNLWSPGDGPRPSKFTTR